MNRVRPAMFALALALAPNGLAQDAPEPEPVAEVPADPDAALESRLNTVYSRVEKFSGATATVEDGIVVLDGSLLDAAAIEEAQAFAESQDGVLYVDNRLDHDVAVDRRMSPAIAAFSQRIESVVAWLPLLALSTLVLLGGWLVARFVSRTAGRRMSRGRPLLQSVVVPLLRYAMLLAVLLVVFDLLGLGGLFGAMLGAVGVVGIAVGFAFQDIVENLLAGFLLALQHPFAKDDLVRIEGETGKVVRLTLRETVLMTQDGNHLRIPNAIVYKAITLNYTRNPLRRFEFAVGVGTDVPLAAALREGLDVLRELDGVLEDPHPNGIVEELGDSTVVLRFYAWVDQTRNEFIVMRSEAIRKLKARFEARSFDMPEPIYRVRMLEHAVPAAPAEPDEPPVATRAEDPLAEQVERDRAKAGGEDLLSR